ncbi:hypothetical protein K438DRAFT_1598282 [Mycena galopus ATCC 62051]|nr:hypothetical protein K438DRAFT_1598282 [Mycena galopus ATCC 62051]
MIVVRGLGRGSFLWGSSTNNTRIERLWVEVGSQFAHFRAEWNCHPVSGAGHDQSPDVLPKLNEQDGMYVDDYDNVHPSVLAAHYGVHGARRNRPPGQTGAGQLEDEEVPLPSSQADDSDGDSDSDDEDDLEAYIAEAHADNFHHEAIPVPKHAEPFEDETVMQLFYDALAQADTDGTVFAGYGLLPGCTRHSRY